LANDVRARRRACETVDGEEERQALTWDGGYLRDVVFASGSPYPVFPAHAVKGEKDRLVDGGYANNVPIDAAQSVGADEVLIVESSNPLGHESAPGWLRSVIADTQVGGDLIQ